MSDDGFVLRDQGTGSLKEDLGSIAPELTEMRRRREERRRQFSDVTERVNRIHQEMNLDGGQPRVVADSSDLTLTKLDELRAYLQHLQSEKVQINSQFGRLQIDCSKSQGGIYSNSCLILNINFILCSKS